MLRSRAMHRRSHLHRVGDDDAGEPGLGRDLDADVGIGGHLEAEGHRAAGEPLEVDVAPPRPRVLGVVHADGGRLVELGNHTELIALGGRYAALADAWAKSQPVAGA